ncbi:glutathione S-transferase 1-like [Zerene cesonia]|uniref:glutathione S-transferase 1-like n=1 Tax=Zerene cesonia TaxID=33412 RepID=UPI0018E4FF73|nr:glutathione S-transferase 1-like [Zerene cesonia]
MSLKLYHYPLSAPSRAALLAIKNIGIPVEVIVIDLMKKEQLSESFTKINPQHCVPTIVDEDGFVLWESKAIACYLVEKYEKYELYPKDLKRRAIVNQRLYYECSMLYPRMRAINYPILFQGVKEIKQSLKDDLNSQMVFLEQYLSKSKWVAGDNLTIADTAILASISTMVEVGWDMMEYPNILRWLKDCESIPGYSENLEGAKMFGAAVKKNLNQ